MRARPSLLAFALLAGVAAAQPALAPEETAAAPVPAPAAEAPPPPPPAALARPARSNPLARVPRITAELILGGASAAGMAYGGYQLGCALSPEGSYCGQAGSYGLFSGFALGIPIGVMLGGSLLDGDGGILPTLFGTGLGLVAGFTGLIFLQHSPNVDPTPLVSLPLVLAVIGYEISSHDSRAAAQAEARGKRLALSIVPSAAIIRGGAAFGVAGTLP